MNERLLLLAADLLSMAADEFGKHGCNDYRMPAEMSDQDREALALLMNRQNFRDCPPSAWPAEDVEHANDLRSYGCDFAMMSALAFGLREMVRDEDKRGR